MVKMQGWEEIVALRSHEVEGELIGCVLVTESSAQDRMVNMNSRQEADFPCKVLTSNGISLAVEDRSGPKRQTQTCKFGSLECLVVSVDLGVAAPVE